MISGFIFGLTMFNDLYLKFSNKLKKIVTGVIIASVINIILNLIFIPLFDYKVAATTTLVSYTFLYLFYSSNDGFSYLKYRKNRIIVLRVFLILSAQILLDQLIRRYFGYDLNFWQTIAEGSIFLLIYCIIIFWKRIILFIR